MAQMCTENYLDYLIHTRVRIDDISSQSQYLWALWGFFVGSTGQFRDSYIQKNIYRDTERNSATVFRVFL